MAWSKFFDEMDLELVDGDFYEGETVTVRVDGKEYRRKVRYSAKYYADLYVVIKNTAFTWSDFYRCMTR